MWLKRVRWVEDSGRQEKGAESRQRCARVLERERCILRWGQGSIWFLTQRKEEEDSQRACEAAT